MQSSPSRRAVIVGSSFAGMTAALELRKHLDDDEVVVLDRLLIATGPRLAFEKIPGLGPHDGHTQSVCNLDHALLAKGAWNRFLENPGPVVIGTAQGGSCFGASYEFLFNVPPFAGVDAVREVEGLGNPAGFIPVDDEFRHPEHREIYAAGVAIAIAPPEPTAVRAGVPKTGQMSETMARVAARNRAADLRDGKRRRLPLPDLAAICVLDAGNNGIVFKADHVLANGDRASHARVMAGPQAHWAKFAFERYFLASRSRRLITV